MAAAKTEELISLMVTVNRLMREQTAGRGKIDAPSLLQLKVLSIVSEKGTPTMKEIAAALYITPPSATAAIHTLVKDAQLKRIYDTNDRRIVRLQLTEKGKNKFKARRREMLRQLSAILAALNKEEKAAFVSILKKIINSYKR